jgi:hypothetical protein
LSEGYAYVGLTLIATAAMKPTHAGESLVREAAMDRLAAYREANAPDTPRRREPVPSAKPRRAAR